MVFFSRESTLKSLPGFFIAAFFVVSCFFIQPAFALTDYMYFSVNGDTTLSEFSQGDTVGWGSNCAVGAKMYWELWYDINADSVINPGVDKFITSFSVTDGVMGGDGPDGDISPVADGWYQAAPFILGIAPGQYMFSAMDLTDSTSVERAFICNALVSPPNQFTGWVTVPGYPAPDNLLKNVWVEAESQEAGFWSALTDDNGYFEINIGSIGNGQMFEIFTTDIPGFVTPSSVVETASGVVDSIYFDYSAAIDSIYGYVKDNSGNVINTVNWIFCQPNFFGPPEREVQTVDGRYVIYFGSGEEGDWYIDIDGYGLTPDYLAPDGYSFNNESVDGIEYDFAVYPTDTSIYVEVTENGGLPANNYLIYGWSSVLQSSGYGVSGTGSDNIVEIRVSSLDNSGWFVDVSNWDDSYPIPDGFIVENGGKSNVGPGDTVSLNLINGFMVSGNITQDPGDGPIDWNEVWVNLSSPGKDYGATPAGDGSFTVYADNGSYTLSVFSNNYLITPGWRDIVVTGDTTVGLDFTINETHCRVTGTLLNIPTPIDGDIYISVQTGIAPDGYQTWAQVDSLTGTYEFYLCDGDWTMDVPFFDGFNSPAQPVFTVGEAPDTVKTVDLDYSIILDAGDEVSGGLPTNFALRQNYPNPFNPVTEISFDLPAKNDVRLSVYNLLGQKVAVLFDGQLEAGSHSISWDGADASGNTVATGVYLYRLEAGDFVQTRKMLLLK